MGAGEDLSITAEAEAGRKLNEGILNQTEDKPVAQCLLLYFLLRVYSKYRKLPDL